MDTEFPTNAFQVRPQGAGGHAQKRGSLALIVAQHQALKSLDLSLGEAQHLGDACPRSFTEETTAIAGFTGIGHRDPHISYCHILNCDSV